MDEMTIQWIVVGIVLALCLWRIISSVNARRRARRAGCARSQGSSCSCGSQATHAPSNPCSACPLSPSCTSPKKKS